MSNTYLEMCDNASDSNESDTLWALFMVNVKIKADSVTVLYVCYEQLQLQG